LEGRVTSIGAVVLIRFIYSSEGNLNVRRTCCLPIGEELTASRPEFSGSGVSLFIHGWSSHLN